MKNRIKYFDGLRFFAILSIILIHVNSIFRYKYFQTSTMKFLLMTFFDSFTRAGVPLFFMLTGILMFTKKDTKESYVDFFKKRVIKLIVAYFVFSLIYYVYSLIKGNVSFSIYNLLSQITSGQTMYHLWFMPVIILIYTFIPFLKKLVLNLKETELKTMILLIFLLGNVFSAVTTVSAVLNHALLRNFTIPSLVIYTNYLFLGYYLYKYDVKITKKLVITSIISILLMPVLTILVSRTIIDDSFLNSTSPLVILPSILIFELFKKYYTKIKLPEFIENFIGKNSGNVFYVYLWHVLIMTIFDEHLRKYTEKTGLLTDFLFILLYYSLTVVFSFLVAIIWEKIKKQIIKYKEVISTFLINVFLVVFTLTFSIVYINLILNKYHFIKMNYIFYILGIVVMILLFYLINRYQDKIFKYKAINILMLILYVVLQIVFMNAFTVKPSWDFGTVYDIAVRFATGKGSLNTEYYLYMCDNNIGIATIFSIIFKIFYILGVKKSFLTIGLAINCICIDISLLFTYLTLRKIKEKNAKPFFVFCLLFTPLICYLPIFYTDTLTLPFIAIPIYYLYLYIFEHKKNIYLIIAGLLLGIGGILKPTVLIVLVAIIIFLILKNAKAKQINYYKFFAIVLLCVAIPFVSYKVYVKYYFEADNFYNNKIPMNHYIMMGLNGNGGFTQEDYEFTAKIVGLDNKKEADNKLLKERLNKMLKNKTIVSFYNKKLSYTWTDGTFFAGEKLRRFPKKEKNIKYINSSDNSDIIYWTISNVEWSILILLMIIGTVLRKHLPEKLQEMQLITNISIFGLVLFLLLWETRSRYILNFTPIFLISGYIGIQAIINYSKSKKTKKN